jgi:lipid A 3-O-deacylase
MVQPSSKVLSPLSRFSAVPFDLVSRRANLSRSRFAQYPRLGWFVVWLTFAASACAQQPSINPPSNALADGRGSWDLGAFLGGGTGAGKSSNTQFLFAGGRAGLVLTPDLARSTFLRGNLEYAVEVMPVYTVFTPNGAVYGGSIKPFILRWNFTANRRLLPYFHFSGGVLFTTSDVPPPDTSSINFTPQLGGGLHWFIRPRRSVDFGLDLVHHSNASLGDHNPGYNASLFFSVGYSWYKRR